MVGGQTIEVNRFGYSGRKTLEIHSLTLVQAQGMIQSGQISPLELTQACLSQIKKLNPQLNCFITLTAELALEDAHRLEQNYRRTGRANRDKPLWGIPLALKDLFETRGVRTTAGSPFFTDHIPQADASSVARLRQAGAILLGKLNMHEIALGVTNVNPHFGACRNPWDQERIPGGSSGGSAAALAAGLCLGSLGSDSGGSIRIPASLCGVVGLKPTFGRVSLRGVIPLSWNTDHAGPMAKCVLDAAILLQVIAGYDADDPNSVRMPRGNYLEKIGAGVAGWRIALVEDEYLERSDEEIRRAVESAALVFERLGAQVIPAPLPGLKQAAQANLLMVTSDGAAFHRERLESQADGFGEDVRRRLQAGAATTSGEYIQARRTQTVLRRTFEQFFGAFDLLLLPTTPVAAPLISGPDAVEQARLLTRYTAPFNLTGLPALSLPCGFTTNGLPIGLQIVAPPWQEARLLKAGYAFEQTAGWQTRRPNL
jgi:aspartyl-tRNA(Asn)/glutamyl-tRNA(Gln) amidotransferase subunit A